jgi:hypothetical protein
MVIFTIRYFRSIFLFAQLSDYDCWDKVHITLVRWQRSLLVHDTFHSLLQAMGYGVLSCWNPYLAETSSDIAALVHNREGCCLSGRISSHHRCSATLYILGSSWCGCECNLRSLGVGSDALFPGLGRRGWVPQCKSYLRGEECGRDGAFSNWACGLESLVQLRHSCRCMLDILPVNMETWLTRGWGAALHSMDFCSTFMSNSYSETWRQAGKGQNAIESDH